MESKEEEAAAARSRLSCMKCLDALGFCYSPVYQMQQYYRLGALDNCSTKWSALFDCFNLKTKRVAEAEEILQARENEKLKAHIWTYRTKEEASTHWKELFGDKDDMYK